MLKLINDSKRNLYHSISPESRNKPPLCSLVSPLALPYLLFFSKVVGQLQIPPTCRRETRGHHADPFPVKGILF